jgi:formate transporter
MDYVKPVDVVKTMTSVGAAKAKLSWKDVLVRGMLSGALLGVATSLAFAATLQTQKPIVGALIFPAGFVMIVLLGLELVTGSFAVVPLARLERTASLAQVLNNLALVFVANLLGSLLYAALLAVSLNSFGHQVPSGIAPLLVGAAEAKTIAYARLGVAGMSVAFVKAILCNWMVCLGVVMAMTSNSTLGKIVAAWLPILTFFAQGFEHSVVNMFVIPAGMMLGAKVSLKDWWLWNQIPVTLGNFLGGFLFTGLALYYTYRPREQRVAVITKESLPAMIEGEEVVA